MVNMVDYKITAAIAALLVLGVAVSGCLSLSDTGQVKIVFNGAEENVNVTALVENSGFNTTYNIVVIGGTTQEIVLEDVPSGSYYVEIYYYGELQEKRIINLEPEDVVTEEFTIMDKTL